MLSPDDLKTLMEGLIRNTPNSVEFVNKLAQGAKEQVEKLRQIPIKDEPTEPSKTDDDDDDDSWDDDMSWMDDAEDDD